MITLGDCLRKNDPENHKGWAKHVKDIKEQINTTQHESTGLMSYCHCQERSDQRGP